MTNSIDTLTTYFCIAMLWGELDDMGNNLDDRYSISDISVESMKEIRNICKDFYHRAEVYLADMDLEQVGYDLYFTIQGHGTGFWDRPDIYGADNAEKLTVIVDELFSNKNIYIDENENETLEISFM